MPTDSSDRRAKSGFRFRSNPTHEVYGTLSQLNQRFPSTFCDVESIPMHLDLVTFLFITISDVYQVLY